MKERPGEEQGQAVVAAAERDVASALRQVDDTARVNQRKVLDAFSAERVAESDLHGSTGYGLSDGGRDKLDRVFARIFGAERALVRPQIVSGTHALSIGLFGITRPGDEIVFGTGRPYETLEEVVGLRPARGSLAQWGVTHRVVGLTEAGGVDLPGLLAAISPSARVVFLQRSRGYAARNSLPIDRLAEIIETVRDAHPHVSIVVDNCYGEFVEPLEPCDVGAHMVIGSLIKNPGGGIVPTGGYIAGEAELVQSAAAALTAPGIGAEVGATDGFLRLFYQGLFLAPHVVAQALKGSILASRTFEKLGLSVSPRWDEPRGDLILRVELGSAERLLTFCESVQRNAPVDSFIRPYGSDMAGYANPIVMAAGTFVQGATLELSADAPVAPPYCAYLQGGLTYEHVYVSLERMASALF